MEEMNKRRAIAKSSTFWNRWDDEMYAKTALHMAVKTLPSSVIVDQLNDTEKWIYESDSPALALAETTETRIDEIRALFDNSDKAQRFSAWSELQPNEQENKDIQKLYKTLNAKHNAAKK